MLRNIRLGLVITAAGFGQAAGAFGTVENRVGRLGKTLEELKVRQKTALGSMEREWAWGGDAVKRYALEVDKLDQKIQKISQRKLRIEALAEQQKTARTDLNSRLGEVAAVYGMGRMMAAPVGAFVRQDDALNALQVAMMDKNGQVGESYEMLKRQAVELGNILPGTTADFVGTARALMEQGVAINSVLNGGLKSAAYLSVVLRIPADQAGEMAAKLREAYALSDDELTKMADSMQRAKFAFGMKPTDLMAASSYQAPMLNQLGISGLANTNKMLAIQGMAAQVGLEGSSFGTNFSMMLARLAKGPLMVEQARKGMKAEARKALDQLGIEFNFFDKKGNFAGLDHMVKELEKLQVIKDKLGDKAALEVSESMFGAEAGRPAMILAKAGSAGFADAQKRMAEQADLQQRIGKTLESTRNTWEALTGSVQNFAAAAAGPAVQALHPLINTLNSAAGSLTNFASAHPTAAKWLGLTVAALGAATIGFLSLGVALSFGRFALAGAKLLPGVLALGRGAAWLGGVLRGSLLIGLRLVGTALMFVGRVLLFNPIGLIITGIATAAFLLYKYWQPISAWFGSIWAKVKSGFGSAWEWFKSLPARFGKLGGDLIDGLIGGIERRMASAKEAIVNFARNVKDWFADKLGIRSPSKVFMGFGHNIGQGAQLGIVRSLPGVQRAVSQLAGVALAGSMGATGGALAATPTALAAKPGQQSGASAQVTIHFSPVINLQAAGDVSGQVNAALQLSLRELEQMLRRVQQDQARRAF